MSSAVKLRATLRAVYHWLPVSQRRKWLLRERLLRLTAALQRDGTIWGLATDMSRARSEQAPLRDNRREHALASLLEVMADHASRHGPLSHWIVVPFLGTGGAEMVALNFCRALRELRPAHSVLLLITDRKLVSECMTMPAGVLRLVMDDYLDADLGFACKKWLLRDLLIAARPNSFHNINSEVAWHLILDEGESLKRYTRLFASIFAFQFAGDGRNKIGYAAYFLKKGMPYLSGLLSDNRRFVDDAVVEYQLTEQEQARMHVLYQPCRVFTRDGRLAGREHPARRRLALTGSANPADWRPQVLWAGRLDEEKRIDLFLDVVRRCTFADFRVFGQVVVGDDNTLPALPNLSYEGPFASPLDWLGRYNFDAFMFTSRWEGMPNILIEVGALGIPVIAPTVGGVAELITETTGYPLPERPTVADYEQALLSVIKEPTKALQRAEQLREWVQQHHSWDGFVASVAAVTAYVGSSLSDCGAEESSPARGVIGRADTPVRPLVSVIIPCYNQGRYLQQSIASAVAACRHPLEIIVIDDGSTDITTARHLAEAEEIAPGAVRIRRQSNCGLSGARNSGIALARGQYIQFLDADDVLVPGKIDIQVAQMQINPDLAISVCNYLLCDDTRTHFSKHEEAIARFDLSIEDFLYRWERGFAIPIHCGLFRRSLLETVQFDTQARAKEDWLFWTSLVMMGTKIGYIHGHWAIYRQHEQSMRRSYVDMGRAWLQAGLKIDDMLAGLEPLFFESVISWFEHCYRSHSAYRKEIAQRAAAAGAAVAAEPTANTAPDATRQARSVADSILNALARLPDTSELPLISVVIPIYGHFEYLQSSLESLAVQGDVSIEVVCIDDGSPDQRITLLMQNLRGKNPRLKVHVEPSNRGISEVLNIAVDLACGEYVAFLDCDDALEPRALQAVRYTLETQPGIDYLFTDRIDVDDAGKIVRFARYGGYDNLHFTQQNNIGADLVDGMVASHLKVIRRRVYQTVGGCNPAFTGVQDWELALRIAQTHELYYLAQPLYRHRVHRGSVTTSDSVSQFRKTNQVRRKYLESWRASSPDVRTMQVFCARDFPVPLERLKNTWKHGGVCIADMRGNLNIGQINLLREFNSYFDQIVWSNPEVPAALFGYLCKETKLIGEVREKEETEWHLNKDQQGTCHRLIV